MSTVDSGDTVRRDSIQLRHSFDFAERHLVVNVKQKSRVTDAPH